ncbi:hypothetical protein GCM10010464_77230 [Pseudonocardia yunnanensis]|uniref:SDR family oxidoreductase n=1 Tax=Pseudonocardia yunnanensis TaxID=58107 RepID=A0ABW4EWD4_9PSEU
MPFPGISVYAASKGAIVGLTKGLARELAPKGITIQQCAAGPGRHRRQLRGRPCCAAQLNAMALDRFGDAGEIGAFVSFLAGPDGGFFTGASLSIDGACTS